MENNIVNIKLKNGKDIIGFLREVQDKYVLVENPLDVAIGPEYNGFFAKSYLMFAEGTIVRFNKSDLLLLAKANKKAVQYYEDFYTRVDELEEQENEIVSALNDSQFITKH